MTGYVRNFKENRKRLVLLENLKKIQQCPLGLMMNNF